ncbi:90S pre-ribosomal component [Komagataella phaffii]|uniref:Conserved 90S pre-ribosomal component essential for proper endonucleolytic cleavage of the 35 S rRNA n=1 Tax=Komagataella phaffii (strain GS115 / ATCC 20864) TaxID=644223 RepID=C4R055_KOMPG|nr:Conserved 90S pre-ribosomal component essential for proper endonucleolytic cleavage of the 35 S rRNA [Komagataella phaffii GS115]AOA62879.1 GQ67_00298T0 [Komagataella phaffii]AOA67540.1 GQ68_01091T0 [Komagataella phaffii GS115]CAY68879.1 Conserved 90S pre-ribosomal component essential for proper endonucleolytic cleavage of the 35 S rRNA [Komagataella phaffii GS115]
MKSDFQFSNLLGTVYRQGNLVFINDGNTLISPVGNRVSVFDLINNKSFTFPYEHRRDVAAITVNKQGTLLMSVDEHGRAILVNFKARIVLHHFNFKSPVKAIEFSPDGHYFAVGCGKILQIWRTPNVLEDKQFAPFVRHAYYTGHYDDITSVSWSGDSQFVLTTSKDMTTRLYGVDRDRMDEVRMTLGGHRDYVVNAFFDEAQEVIYTVSKDGALFRWEYTSDPKSKEDEYEEEDEEDRSTDEDGILQKPKKPESWRIVARHYFFSHSKLKCAAFHPKSNILVVGFGNGEFRLYELPTFTLIQQLSMGQNSVNTVSINASGEWLAFGSSTLGQLLVYEWQSESYILKQQGHFDAINALTYSPDGSRVVTAADDGKIKIWDVLSGFCLATFEEHSSAVTSVRFAKRGQVLFSSSLDGTVRAWDLIRFRNFRTFTAPERVQFGCLAVDPSGEVVCAGSLDDFQIHVWSVQTGALLDSLAGHEGPVSCLSFGQEGEAATTLASASWDKTIRVWNIFGRSQQVEPFEVYSEVLAIDMRPDGKEVAVSTLNGQILFWNVESGNQTNFIDAKRDIQVGRYSDDRFEAKNSKRGKCFSTISYSFDGLSLIAAGDNNSICLYDVKNSVLLRKFTVSLNMNLEGTLKKLNSKNLIEGGPIDLLDRDGENSDYEDRVDLKLPGSHRGDPSVRNIKAAVRVTSIAFSPGASSFAAASTEGLLIYSVDDSVNFDPFDLDIDITPASCLEMLEEKEFLIAVVMSFRLNERYLIHRIYESIPLNEIDLIVADLPKVYVERFLRFIGELSLESQHIEFNLIWIKSILAAHGKYISAHKFEFSVATRMIQRFLARIAKDVVKTSVRNGYLAEFLLDTRTQQDSIRIEEEKLTL